MKIIFFIFLITLVLFCTVTAQPVVGSIINDQLKKSGSVQEIYPIPGSHLLQQEWQKTEPLLKAYIKSHANELAAQNLKKTSTWGFAVGQARTWWATNMNPSDPNYNKEYQTSSTCQVVGSNCYIFVEDSLWTNTTVTQAAVDSIRTAFELRTPGDPSKGIFQLDTMYFGNPPDLDNDPKIIILILDIQDNFTGTGGYIAGYFNPLNEYTEAEVQSALGTRSHSNQAEIYYIDANPARLKTSSGITAAASTTAHEFQHMIFWNYSNVNNVDKLTFINEGMSESASVLCGYDLENPSRYYSNTNVDFLSWKLSSDALPDYSRAALFSWYLIEQFGSPLTKSIVQNSFDAIACYNNAFQTSGSSLRFNDVIKNFALAAEINDKTFDPKYGFTVSIPIKPIAVTYYYPNVSSVTDTVKPYGTRYIKFASSQSLSVDVNSNGSLEVKAIATGTAGIQVDNVTLGTTYTLNDFGTSHSSVVLAITNLTNVETVFTYAASGTGSNIVELRYDYSEPVAADLGFVNNDTVCVVFDAVQNGKLDSIRVALRRNTLITGGIWRYTGVVHPSPLGQLLASNLRAAGPGRPPVPYPVPWTNWATIDVRSLNISTNSRFAVGFRIDGTYPDDANVNRVMITESPLPAEPTSLTYLSDEASWHYITSNTAGDSVYTYLIRAYVSIDTSGGRPDTILTPASYVLEQNYPNPFNQSTIIRFHMPSDGLVKLKIYDIIGREVATLVNGLMETGTHNIEFDASNLPSGVYLYRITSGAFAETKKLVLIR